MANKEKILSIFNRLFALEQYSLANYLMDAHPWVHDGDQRLVQTVQAIARDQQFYAEQLGRWIVEHEASVAPACYPMRFTAYNDVSIEFLMNRLLDEQKHLVEEIERLVPELEDTEEPYELAQQILGSEKAHLENLREALTVATTA